MSEVLERWKVVMDGFAQRLHAVRDNQWDDSTPCPEFTVRQLVTHVIDVQRMVPKALGATGAIDTPVGDTLQAAWNTVHEAALAAYSAEGALEKVVESPPRPNACRSTHGASGHRRCPDSHLGSCPRHWRR